MRCLSFLLFYDCQSTSNPTVDRHRPEMLNIDDIIYTEEDDKATLMNNFFVARTEFDKTQATLPPDITLPEHSLIFLSTLPSEVETMLKPLQLGKATGPDAINNCVLKGLAKPLSFPLSDLFNFSLTSRKVSLIWKAANVTPIFKKDDL